ncbi:transcription initiation factor IIF, beta subunit-domain-containing protein [Cantharellus anzutake]|uniref:transcription initiation factor IIF, beta subunit-domain-containing protein n=1 Tax=Cantharellus anzutake TaxID=1750568 RepID=UPI001905429A|nr:transcription initiation factor IIF, beta subunit-domain-containing protein [Cantharellus anzutake]KAF8339921.1 transcription initiation factor IIF, beta subunit-domain-containing protein [Cantharellus anzutake]
MEDAEGHPPKREQFEDDGLLDGEDGDEPNEYLELDPNSDASVWLVKVPKSLMETWSNVQKPQTLLGTVRVWANDVNGSQRVQLLLPETPEYTIGDEPTEYSLDVTNQTVQSQYVLTDQPNDKSANKRTRKTRVIGQIKHHASLKPLMSDQYVARIRRRAAQANKPRKSIVMLEDRQDAGGSNLKMVQSGAIQTNAGFNLAKKSSRPTEKPQFERAARISRNELLDQLFTLFTDEEPYWSMKDLRRRTNQPEAYLKEILNEIADLQRGGPHNTKYSLKPGFNLAAHRTNAPAMEPDMSAPGVKDEEMEGADDDEDEDEDMEEIG